MLQLVSKETHDIKGLREGQLVRKRFQLAKLLRCTEEMLNCAQKCDWDSVEALERTRKGEMAACFSDQNEHDTPLIAEALATLIHLNSQITLLVKQAKDEVLRLQQTLQKGRSAARSYQDNQESLETG